MKKMNLLNKKIKKTMMMVEMKTAKLNKSNVIAIELTVNSCQRKTIYLFIVLFTSTLNCCDKNN